LGDGSTESHHGETAILELLVLELVDLGLVLSLKKGSSESEVSGFATRSLEHFRDTNVRDHLEETDEDKGITHHALIDKDVVGGGGGQALSEGVDDNSNICGDVSDDGKHGNTSVPTQVKMITVSITCTITAAY
jgi:hypothetical protein